MGYLYALRGGFFHQLKYGMDLSTVIFSLVTHVPIAVVLAWIASKGSGPVPIDYLFVGIFLMSVWNWITIRMGWSLTGELIGGTSDYTTTSRTPLGLIIFGRAVALTAASIPSGIAPLLMILWISGQVISASEPLILVAALIIGVFNVIFVAFVFAPLFLLVRGREGLFNLIRPLGVVFCGFLYPVAFLAPGVEVVARFLPVSWAMDAVLLSLDSKGAAGDAAQYLAIALAISLAYLAFSQLLLRRIEYRIRVIGDLGRF